MCDFADFISPHPPDTWPSLLQLTHLILPSGKKLKIIEYIAAKWRAVGIHFNFDSTGHTLDIIAASNPSDPIACCTYMMKLWLEGKGRQPASWATLVKILRDAELHVLADDVEQLVPVNGGEGYRVGDTGEYISIPCHIYIVYILYIYSHGKI